MSTIIGNINEMFKKIKSRSVQYLVCRAISIWMLVVTCTILGLSKYASGDQKKFYRFGPNSDLKILGLNIDNGGKYFGVVIYCFINSMFRTLYQSILHAWLINNVQDESKEKPRNIKGFAYEVTCVTTIYMWFDWFIYMNILLSQIDMVLIEICADLLMSVTTTMYYLKTGPQTEIDETSQPLRLNVRSSSALQ